jgi:hypothetical protein
VTPGEREPPKIPHLTDTDAAISLMLAAPAGRKAARSVIPGGLGRVQEVQDELRSFTGNAPHQLAAQQLCGPSSFLAGDPYPNADPQDPVLLDVHDRLMRFDALRNKRPDPAKHWGEAHTITVALARGARFLATDQGAVVVAGQVGVVTVSVVDVLRYAVLASSGISANDALRSAQRALDADRFLGEQVTGQATFTRAVRPR